MNSYNAELQHSWMANGQYQTTAPLLFAGFGKLMHGELLLALRVDVCYALNAVSIYLTNQHLQSNHTPHKLVSNLS